MQALQVINGKLHWGELPSPLCGSGQVRIRIAAAGLNRADVLQRDGHYPPPPGASAVPGLECSGVVMESGGNTGWEPGDAVCALLPGGGMAEEVVVDGRHVLPLPSNLSFAEGAVLPEAYATAWLNLFQLAALKKGEKVLIHAGASGVGSAAIQLCRVFGNPCWVSVGSDERLAYCRSLGAEGGAIRNRNLESLKEQAPFDVILDPVGSGYSQLNLQLLGTDGRWILIAMMGGRYAEVDMARMLGKRIRFIGSTLRSRDDDFKAELISAMKQRFWPLFENGDLSPRLVETFPVQEAGQAFNRLESNQVNGKLALIIDPART